MAKRSKKSSGARASKAAKATETIEDAEVVAEISPEGDELEATLAAETAEVAEGTDAPVEEPVSDSTSEDQSEPVEASDDVSSEDVTETAPDERVKEVVETTPPVPPQDNVTVQKVGFVPLALGGLVAGGIGYGAAVLGAGDQVDYQSLIDGQAGQIETLTAELAALPDAPDLAPFETTLSELEAQATALADAQGGLTTATDEVSSALSAVEDSLSGFDERLTAVERAPGEEGEVTSTAIASFERELAELREELASQEARMQEIADSATAELTAAREAAAADLAAVRAQAEEAEAAARAEAEAALAAAAVSEVRAAAESGAPFEEAIAKLGEVGLEVPEALSVVAASGVPTQASLTEAFPDLARTALDVARSESAGDQGAGGVGSFFANQLGVRSVEPREGDDPDAVLSRAEAAARDGDIDAALAEIEALPEGVQAVFEDWAANAANRSAALVALTELDSTVN